MYVKKKKLHGNLNCFVDNYAKYFAQKHGAYKQSFDCNMQYLLLFVVKFVIIYIMLK